MQILRLSGVVLASIEKLVKGLWKAKMNLIRSSSVLQIKMKFVCCCFFRDSMGRACKSIKVW